LFFFAPSSSSLSPHLHLHLLHLHLLLSRDINIVVLFGTQKHLRQRKQ
jgi:hypothetical protein